MYKLLLSILFYTLLMPCVAQESMPKNATAGNIIIGVHADPFALRYGVSPAMALTGNIAINHSQLFATAQLGLFNYKNSVTSDNPTNYTVTGNFLQAGLTYFSDRPMAKKDLFYFSFLLHYGLNHHQMQMQINDPNWGTQKTYYFDNRENVYGFLFNWGGLLGITPNLKLNSGINLGYISQPYNPFPEIYNFNRTHSMIPGIGFGEAITVGIYFGLTYVIF